MDKIIIAGIGTNVGKTIVSAIITTMVKGDYWKPIESGSENGSDITTMKTLIKCTIHPPAFSLKAPLSPHHAARLENITIDVESIIPPQTNRTLVIEMVGGIFVPLQTNVLSFDLFHSWKGDWILVSNHYLGSINHTLLTLELLKQRGVSLLGIIFNGIPNPDSESAILEISKVPFLGRLLPEKIINTKIIERYAKKWQPL